MARARTPGNKAREAEQPERETSVTAQLWALHSPDLTSCELMNFSLWDPPDVVVGRVGGLLHEQERDSLEELVAGHGRDGQVEEQPVQHREGDEVHWTEMRIMISFSNVIAFSSHLGMRLTEAPMRMLDIRLLTLVSLT